MAECPRDNRHGDIGYPCGRTGSPVSGIGRDAGKIKMHPPGDGEL